MSQRRRGEPPADVEARGGRRRRGALSGTANATNGSPGPGAPPYVEAWKLCLRAAGFASGGRVAMSSCRWWRPRFPAS
ncbi:hypothetical protein GUJ93_ZPchr0010g11136 [Zizania palustris]|uniref:Uncharacterized protein n=1 Tax=Zizania palustris TaxID=103762 RepID=A0A8J5WB33_ZIZPA|nr:hypothetical protein GUJ93_ZPchr0010g11136 [Zizania palustris]